MDIVFPSIVHPRYLSFRARSLSPPGRPQLVVVPPREGAGKEGGGKTTTAATTVTTTATATAMGTNKATSSSSSSEGGAYAYALAGAGVGTEAGGGGEEEMVASSHDQPQSQQQPQQQQQQQQPQSQSEPPPAASSTTTHLPQIIRGRALARHNAPPDGAVFPHTLYSEIVDLSVSTRGQGKACVVRAWNHKRALRSTKPSLNRLQALEKSTENNRKLPVCRVIEGDLQETAG